MKVEIFLAATFYMVTSTCILPSPLILQLILEFAKWKDWDQVVLFQDLTSFGEYDQIFVHFSPASNKKTLIVCFSRNVLLRLIRSYRSVLITYSDSSRFQMFSRIYNITFLAIKRRSQQRDLRNIIQFPYFLAST